MPGKYLPPLNALRAFDVVARTGTIAAAAEELSVSGSAVSQQIRVLEKWLGMALFERSGHKLELTQRGKEYFQSISAAMDMITDASGRVVGGDTEATIRVSVLPSLSTLWLLPRLTAFMEHHPEINIELVTSTQLCDFAKDDIDLAVRYGLGDYPGLIVEKLLPEAVAPVCHPDLVAGLPRNADGNVPADALLTLPMINDLGGLKGVKLDMASWAADCGLAHPSVREALFLSDSHQAVEAAKLGRGLVLGRMVLVRDLLDVGDLVAANDHWMVEPTSYYIVHSGLRPLRPRAQTFRTWLKAVARDWLNDPRCHGVFGPAQGQTQAQTQTQTQTRRAGGRAS